MPEKFACAARAVPNRKREGTSFGVGSGPTGAVTGGRGDAVGGTGGSALAGLTVVRSSTTAAMSPMRRPQRWSKTHLQREVRFGWSRPT